MRKYRLGHTWEEVKNKVDKGEWQFHGYPLGFGFTEVRQFPEEKVCIVHFLHGKDFDSWKHEAHQDLENFARKHGCNALQAFCRLGLERKLKEFGWKRWHVTIRKELHYE